MEMVVYVGLLGIFMVIAGGLIVESMKVTASAEHQEDMRLRLDAAIRQLRVDTWSAKAIQVQGTSVTLLQPDGSRIGWKSEMDPAEPGQPVGGRVATLVRQESSASEPTRYTQLPAAIRFSVHGPVLELSTSADPLDQVSLVSQHMLAGAKP